MTTVDEGPTFRASAVNAFEGDGEFIICLRVDDIWRTVGLGAREAIQLADQLRLLTRTTD